MTENLPKLYKRTQTGAIQEWWIELDHDKYRTHSGKSGGKIVTSKWKYAETTNEGKSNERTTDQQARFEVEAIYTKRLELGYSETPDGVDSTDFFQPMLAKDLKKVKLDFLKNTYYSQPKLDGVRAIITNDGIFSRTGKEIVAVPHIKEAFHSLFEENPDIILDGELYNHELKNDFNQIISMVRQTKVTDHDLEKSKKMVQFHWYDIVSDHNYSVRYASMTTMNGLFDPTSVKIIESHEINDYEHLIALYEKYIQEGYEGQIVRSNAAGYEKKRTKNLLKHKDFDDTEFRILSVEEGKGNRSGMAGFVICQMDDGTDRTFKASVKGTHEYCTELLKNKELYKDTIGTVQHFRRSPDNIPRFPVLKAIYGGKREL